MSIPIFERGKVWLFERDYLRNYWTDFDDSFLNRKLHYRDVIWDIFHSYIPTVSEIMRVKPRGVAS